MSALLSSCCSLHVADWFSLTNPLIFNYLIFILLVHRSTFFYPFPVLQPSALDFSIKQNSQFQRYEPSGRVDYCQSNLGYWWSHLHWCFHLYFLSCTHQFWYFILSKASCLKLIAFDYQVQIIIQQSCPKDLFFIPQVITTFTEDLICHWLSNFFIRFLEEMSLKILLILIAFCAIIEILKCSCLIE